MLSLRQRSDIVITTHHNCLYLRTFGGMGLFFYLTPSNSSRLILHFMTFKVKGVYLLIDIRDRFQYSFGILRTKFVVYDSLCIPCSVLDCKTVPSVSFIRFFIYNKLY